MFEDLNLQVIRSFQAKDPEQKTSDTYRAEAKRFLEKMDIRLINIKSPTYQILHNVLTDLRLPHRGEQLRIRTQQQINLISLILKMIAIHENINEVTIATYTLNKEAFSVLQDLIIGGKIHRVNFFLAAAYSFRSPEEYSEFKRVCLRLSKTHNVHLAFAWLHLKITLARCGHDYYQFEGSMNYSTNNMAEQLVFENCRETYDHDYTFLHDILLNRDQKAIEVIC
jgi:hypothetical protein